MAGRFGALFLGGPKHGTELEIDEPKPIIKFPVIQSPVLTESLPTSSDMKTINYHRQYQSLINNLWIYRVEGEH